MTFYDAITAPEYRKATWVCFTYTLFHSYTGMNVLVVYATTFVSKLNEEGAFPLTPIQASYGMGLGTFIGALLAPFFIENMTRRGNFFYGRTAMWVSMFTMGILNIYE